MVARLRGTFHEQKLSVGLEEIVKSYQPVLLVSGPTAAGKSDLAIRLAEKLSGEIVNTDSVQFYSGLDIGSAKLSPAERGGVPHHLIDILKPSESFNVQQFLKAALSAAETIQERGNRVIFCGGGSLYVTALFHGLARVGGPNPELRLALRDIETSVLHSRLKELDPMVANRLHPNDRVRIIRAIEVSTCCGSMSELQAEHSFSAAPLKGIMLVLDWEREELYRRINLRVTRMLAAGLVKEVENLIAEFGNEPQIFKSIGYSQVVDALHGKLPAAALADQIAMETRRFAKRQLTYWRNEPAKRGWQVREGAILSFAELLSQLRQKLAQELGCNEVWTLGARSMLDSL